VKPKPEEIEEELKKLEDEVYGDHTVSGSNPDVESDDDTQETVDDVGGPLVLDPLGEEEEEEEIEGQKL